MPVQYASIVEEHLATRSGCGLFDVSHMGRLTVSGPKSREWLDRMLTRSVADLQPGGPLRERDRRPAVSRLPVRRLALLPGWDRAGSDVDT